MAMAVRVDAVAPVCAMPPRLVGSLHTHGQGARQESRSEHVADEQVLGKA